MASFYNGPVMIMGTCNTGVILRFEITLNAELANFFSKDVKYMKLDAHLLPFVLAFNAGNSWMD